jgi:RNA polymerase sigma factor (sigma-70 family)
MLQNSVTLWIRAVENHDEAAARALFDRYFHRVLAVARRKLGAASRRVVDEEDIAITAFQAGLARIASPRFPPLKDRDEFWGVLVKITRRRVCDVMRRHLSAKRGGGRVRGESVFIYPGGDQSGSGIAAVPDQAMNQELAAHFAEEYRRLMERLDDSLREVARLVLAGYSTAAIANQTNRTQRTVQRRLRMILEIWNLERQADAAPLSADKAA